MTASYRSAGTVALRSADPRPDDHALAHWRHARPYVGDLIHFHFALKADSHPAIWPASVAADRIAAKAPDAEAHQNRGHSLSGKRLAIRPVDDDPEEIYG